VIHLTSAGTVALEGLVITGGFSSSYGGGMMVDGSACSSECTFTNVVFTANSVGNGGMGGGGVCIYGGYTKFVNSAITDNSAAYGYGAGVNIWTFGSNEVLFEGCTIARNLNTGMSGGGVAVERGNVIFRNSDITGNNASVAGAGGLFVSDGVTSLINTNITGNVAATAGGGLITSGGTTTLTTTLITGNHAPTGANVNPIGGLLYYALPTVAGHWLPNADCVANREGCQSWDDDCHTTRKACTLVSGTTANSWQPTVTVGTTTDQCQASRRTTARSPRPPIPPSPPCPSPPPLTLPLPLYLYRRRWPIGRSRATGRRPIARPTPGLATPTASSGSRSTSLLTRRSTCPSPTRAPRATSARTNRSTRSARTA
jgi:hypothetical protein